jgi:RimJ/RimL family protein N-acetyltransferase
MGMTDPANATLRVLEAIREARFEGTVDVVLGAAAPHRAAVAAALPPGARLHLDPPDIPALIAEADLAIGAGGVSALERACLGLPSLLVVVAENQRAAIAGLVAAGAARPLGPLGALSPRGIVESISSLTGSPTAIAEMARAAARTCDGLGAVRTAIALAPERARDGTTVSLRPAAEKDCLEILAWQEEPGARAHFHNPAIPSMAEHRAWFARTLSDPDRTLSIISCDGRPAGYIRLDRNQGQDAYEVSILVSAAFQRRGVAAAGLRCAGRLIGASTLIARIRPANLASRRAFASAGFVEGSDGQTWICRARSTEAAIRR